LRRRLHVGLRVLRENVAGGQVVVRDVADRRDVRPVVRIEPGEGGGVVEGKRGAIGGRRIMKEKTP